LLASLIHDLIRRQHVHVTEKTRDKANVDKLRQESLRTREHAVTLIRAGKADEVERYWRTHIEHMRDLVLTAYKGRMTIEVLNKPARKALSKTNVRRSPRTR